MSFDGLWILSSLGGGNILISLPDSLFSNIVIENENKLTFHCQSHRNCFFIAYGMADPNTNPGTQSVCICITLKLLDASLPSEAPIISWSLARGFKVNGDLSSQRD